MAYIIDKSSSYNDIECLGLTENEMIAQSLYFNEDFIIRRVVQRVNSLTINSSKDLQFRCELRTAIGPDFLLDKNSIPVLSSSWIKDEVLLPTDDYARFLFDGLTVLQRGFYYLCFVSNVSLLNRIEFSAYSGGSSLGKLIKIDNGTGIYRQDKYLTLLVDGTWQLGQVAVLPITVSNIYMKTTIRDAS